MGLVVGGVSERYRGPRGKDDESAEVVEEAEGLIDDDDYYVHGGVSHSYQIHHLHVGQVVNQQVQRFWETRRIRLR